MINKLINISNISVIDQNINNNIYGFSSIDFEDEINKGGFGSIHKIIAIDGKQKNKDKYLLKVFNNQDQQDQAFETIKLLHKKIKKQQLIINLPIFHSHPELLGLPFSVFYAINENTGKKVVAFLMYNLEYLGFEDYGSDDKNKNNNELQNLELPDRLYLAYQFAKTVEFFHNIKFIHSDLKEASLFINPRRVQLAFIDFDSGYHFDKQKKPLTLGAITQWASDFWKKIIRAKDSSVLTFEDRINEERWLLSNAIFQILFSSPPFFFLKEADSIDEYLKYNNWPDTKNKANLYSEENLEHLKEVTETISIFKENGFEKLINALYKSFNEGAKKATKRLTASEWKRILYDIVNEITPEIKSYISSKGVITRKNEEVSFNWEVTHFNQILLNEELIDIGINNKEIQIKDTSNVILKCKNDFSEVESKIIIKADKKQPEIKEIKLSDKVRKSINDYIEISWECINAEKVKITSINEELPPVKAIKVYPTKKTKYTLTAIGFFDEEVSKEIEIDVIKPKIIDFDYKINIEKGIDNIDIFWKTENTNKIEITPIIGQLKNLNGETCVKIAGETEFTIKAYGDFGEDSRTMITKPFPIPIIKELMFEYPKLERTFKSTNLLDWNQINNNRMNLVHPDFKVNIPNLDFSVPNDLPSFDINLSINLNQKLNSNTTIENLNFIDLNDEIIKRYSDEKSN